MINNQKLLFVVGPTAVGKTAFAVNLAKKFNGELVSADSRQVYKGMDIGTGKDISKEKRHSNNRFLKIQYRGTSWTLPSYEIDGARIWMYDVITPHESFSVDGYAACAWKVIDDIWKRGHLPIVVGGTGLYISSLLRPIATSSIVPDIAFRKEARNMSVTDLQTMLERLAPSVFLSLNNSDKNNTRRLIRKIEIARSTQIIAKEEKKYDALLVGLNAPNQIVYEKIDRRVDERVRQGIVEEIEGLRMKGFSFSSILGTTLGYKEWKDVCEHNGDAAQAIRRWKFDEHGYARRQVTWFRKMKEITWFDVTDDDWEREAVEKVRQWYTCT